LPTFNATMAVIDNLKLNEDSLTSMNFGLVPAILLQPLVRPSISGVVWFDLNADGILEDGEEFASGFIVTLNCGPSSNMVTSTTTDLMGMYKFYNVSSTQNSTCMVYIDMNQNNLTHYMVSPSFQGDNVTINSKAAIISATNSQMWPLSSLVASIEITLGSSNSNWNNFGFVSLSSCRVPGASYSTAPCSFTSPLNVTVNQGAADEYCIKVSANQGFSISHVDFISISGLPGTIQITSIMDSYFGTLNSNSTWVEISNSGSICAKSQCPGHNVRSANFTVDNNDTTLCLNCGVTDFIIAPVQACFSVQNFSLQQFSGAKLKVGTRGVTGFCDCAAQVTATLGALQCN